MNTLANYTPSLDKLAVSTSAICAVHCLSLPLLIGFFPALGATVFGQEAFHVWLLWLVIPLSAVALTLGCRTHKDWMVALLGVAGLAMLIIAALLGHDLLGEVGERIATLLGASAIAAGHLRNYTLCRRAKCAHE
jgi:hypothetical protein